MFAPARASRRLCRSFRASQHRAFARVCDLWRLLVLAPVSTGRRWCGLPRTSEQLVLLSAKKAQPSRKRDKPLGCVVLVTRNAAGQTQHVVTSYGRVRTVLHLSSAPEVCRHALCQVLLRRRVLRTDGRAPRRNRDESDEPESRSAPVPSRRCLGQTRHRE